MIKHLFILLLSVMICQLSRAQYQDCPCCSGEHKQFDFWLGSWDVFDPSGKKVGENTIVKLENGCLIQEQWTGNSGVTGRSYNFYDPSDDSWNQIWIDNQGNNLQLKGKAKPNKMILKSSPKQNGQGQTIINRITWMLNSDKTVNQVWEVLDKNQNVLQTAFNGIYKKQTNKAH
ncbi:hypothetical protein IFO69_08320 [Echinicola sp. CAU 1574]|uniref:Uncharacterized protein n=1 Tax=Echinicola arenosa TaxID=2774144 RepID=A0ABR9AJ32_9BACT|nr:hypothetical protein [Echinicola arenosa]MBD8488746.1 hypothetical protein [Echinicola arenosa]